MAQSVPTLVSGVGLLSIPSVCQVFSGPSRTMNSTQFHAFSLLTFYGGLVETKKCSIMKRELCPDCNQVMKLVQVVDEKTAVMGCKHCHKQQTFTYEGKTFPSNINSFNWGAFALWPFWGLGNKMAYLLGIYCIIGFTTIFLYFMPSIIGIIISIYLGIKGNRLSWENKDWESVEQFEKVRKIGILQVL